LFPDAPGGTVPQIQSHPSGGIMTSPLRQSLLTAGLFLAAALVAAGGASAHLLGLPPLAHGEFAAGLAHPFSGLDHILAMGAVGVLAAGKGGRNIWLLPALFVAAMVGGFGLAQSGVALSWVEYGIAGSVVALGLAIVCGERLAPWACGALVALCALLHGHAHGTEALALTEPLRYAAGFALATAILHGAGLALGIAFRHLRILPAMGQAIAAAGLLLLLQL
jgi:urease accessory protein